jgi:hypothetical protein
LARLSGGGFCRLSRRVLVRLSGGGFCRLSDLLMMPFEAFLELAEPATEGATQFRESLRTKDDQHHHEQYEQVAWLQKSREHTNSLRDLVRDQKCRVRSFLPSASPGRSRRMVL